MKDSFCWEVAYQRTGRQCGSVPKHISSATIHSYGRSIAWPPWPITPSGSTISHFPWCSLPIGWQPTNGVQTCNQDIAMFQIVYKCHSALSRAASSHDVYCHILTMAWYFKQMPNCGNSLVSEESMLHQDSSDSWSTISHPFKAE